MKIGVNRRIRLAPVLTLLAIPFKGDETGEETREMLGALTFDNRSDTTNFDELLVGKGPRRHLSRRAFKFLSGVPALRQPIRPKSELDVGKTGKLNLN